MKKRDRLCSLTICLIMMFSCFFEVVSAKTTDENIQVGDMVAKATFGKKLETQEIGRVVYGTHWPQQVPTVPVIRDGREAWEIKAQGTTGYIWIDLADSMGSCEQDGSLYEIEVDYYDHNKSWFFIWYESIDHGPQVALENYTTGSGEWKTAKVTIQDALFANRLGNDGAGYDIKLSCREQGYMVPYAPTMYIGEIRVIRKNAVNPVIANAYTDVVGNTFSHFEEKIVHNKFTNTTKEKITVDVTCKIVGERGYEKWKETQSVTLEPKEIKTIDTIVDTEYSDLYRYCIEIKSEEKNISSLFDIFTLVIVRTDEEGRVCDFSWTVPSYAAEGNDEEQYALIELLQKSGYGGVRITWNWGNMEPNAKGVLEYEKHRRYQFIKKMDEKGLEYMIHWIGLNPLYVDNLQGMGVFPKKEESQLLKDWAQNVKNIAELFKGRCTKYELWNEVDHPNFNKYGTPQDYTEFAKVTYEALKSVDPNARLGVLAACNLESEESMNRWLGETLAAGMGNYMDALTLHAYAWGNPDGLKKYNTLIKWKDKALEYGVDKPIWITEAGNTKADPGSTNYNRAMRMPRYMMLNVANGVSEFIMNYNFDMVGHIDIDREDSYGVVSSFKQPIRGKFCIPETPYVGIAGMNYCLADATFSRNLDLDENVILKEFKSNKFNGNVLAMWTAGDSEQVTFDLGVNKVTLYDNYANPTELYSDDGKFTITLENRPKYLAANYIEMKASKGGTIAEHEIREIVAPAGDGVMVKIKNNYSKACTVEISNGDIVQKYENFQSGETKDFVVYASGKEGEKKFAEIKLTDGDKTVYISEVSMLIRQPLGAEISFYPSNSENYNQWSGKAFVRNSMLEKATKGYIEFSEPAFLAKLGKIKCGYVPRNSTIEVDFMLPQITEKGMYNVKFDLFIEGKEEPVHYAQIMDFTMATYAKTTPVIDGKLDEWPSNTAMKAEDEAKFISIGTKTWEGKRDLSANARVMWDEENIYLASVVSDNLHFQTWAPQDAWKGDSLQLAIHFGHIYNYVAMGQANTDFYEFVIGMDRSGTGGFAYLTKVQDSVTKPRQIEDCNVEVIRNEEEKKTYYEARIPWKEILGVDSFVPKTGDKLGFSMLWNDDDGGGRHGWIEYASGIGNSKDSSLFTQVNFIK